MNEMSIFERVGKDIADMFNEAGNYEESFNVKNMRGREIPLSRLNGDVKSISNYLNGSHCPAVGVDSYDLAYNPQNFESLYLDKTID